jgi:hypothetical protein
LRWANHIGPILAQRPSIVKVAAALARAPGERVGGPSAPFEPPRGRTFNALP